MESVIPELKILNESKIEWRNSKTVLLGKSRDPEYELKKRKRIEQIRYILHLLTQYYFIKTKRDQ